MTNHSNSIRVLTMRPLQKFRKERNFNLKQLHNFLLKNDLNVSFATVANWCSDTKTKTLPNIFNAKKLARITGYDFVDFYNEFL